LVPTTGNYFHLHLVSDSTGETLITVARAVAAQYANVTPVEHVYPLVRSQKQLDRVLDEIEEAPGIVLFTLLEKDLVGRLEAKCQEINIPSLSIIGPVMQLFRPISVRHHRARRRAARAQCGIFQAHRRAELHDDA
jgi:regulator of PEP synthase PpsR (kinase-PPPase family)